jgi:hypothetical protein
VSSWVVMVSSPCVPIYDGGNAGPGPGAMKRVAPRSPMGRIVNTRNRHATRVAPSGCGLRSPNSPGRWLSDTTRSRSPASQQLVVIDAVHVSLAAARDGRSRRVGSGEHGADSSARRRSVGPHASAKRPDNPDAPDRTVRGKVGPRRDSVMPAASSGSPRAPGLRAQRRGVTVSSEGRRQRAPRCQRRRPGPPSPGAS